MPQYVDEILAQLGYESNPSALSDDFLWGAISDAVEEIQNAGDWQPHEQTIELVYQPTDDGVALPGLEIVYLERVLSKNPSEPDVSRAWSPVGEATREQWFQRANATDVSPQHPRPPIRGLFYYVWAGLLYLVGVPQDGPVTIRVDGRFLAARFDPSTDPPQTDNYFTQKYPGLVKWLALETLYMGLGEREWAVFAGQRAQRFLTRATKSEAAFKSSGPPKVRGT